MVEGAHVTANGNDRVHGFLHVPQHENRRYAQSPITAIQHNGIAPTVVCWLVAHVMCGTVNLDQ